MSDVQDNTAAQDAATEQAAQAVDQNTQDAPATETPVETPAVETAATDADVGEAVAGDEPVTAGQAPAVDPQVGEMRGLIATVKAELRAILTGIQTRAHNGEAHLVSLIERL